MSTITQKQRRNLNRVERVVGIVGLIYLVVCGFVLAVLSPYVSLTELHPVIAFVVIFAGVFGLTFPIWWVSDRLRRQRGLVCGTCGAWLSFRNSEHGECHRGHQQHSKNAATHEL